MPSTPAYYTYSVAFIYATKADAQKDRGFLAVGLITTVPSSVPGHRHYYLVTNEHVVRGYDSLAVRLNSDTGCKAVTIPVSKFEIAKAIDLAIATLPDGPEFQWCSIDESTYVQPQDLSRLLIGHGTDLFMISRVLRKGMRYLKRNVCVMRFGTIALLPVHEEFMYLVETRSISGHSGSPVFVYATPFIFGNARQPSQEFHPKLLGINRGHLPDYEQIVKFKDGKKTVHPFYLSETNMAISQVVPAWYISELLQRKKFKRQRQRADAKLEPTADIVED